MLFCSLSTRNHNRPVATSDDPSDYYLTTLDYCSLGVGLARPIIQQLIAPHVCRRYFEDPSGYCASRFPASRVGAPFIEQDGLIRRIQEQQGAQRPIAYPFRPRAYHAGFFGYHRSGHPLHGTLPQRIDEVGRVIYNSETMRRATEKPEHFSDSEPVPLDTPAWQGLRRRPLADATPGNHA